MITKTFFKGLSWLLVLNIVVKPAWIFGIDRQVQIIVGNEQYGIYFSLLNLSIILLFVADAGISNMMAQRIAAKLPVNSRQLTGLKLVLLLLYLMVCYALAWASNVTEWEILFYVLLIQALGSLFLFLRSLLVAHQFFSADAAFSIFDKGLMIVVCSLFIYGWWKPIHLLLFLQLQTACIALACIVVGFVLVRKNLFIGGNKENIRKLLKWTAPFATIILLMGMHYRLDGFLLERMATNGPLQAGIYAAAYRLTDAANMLGYLTASFLVAYLARNKGSKTAEAVINLSQLGLLFAATGISVFAILFPDWIQQTLYHTNEASNSLIIQLSLAVLPAYYLIHIYGSVLTAYSLFKVFILVLVASVAINASLNLLLIPTYGAAGSAAAALVSQYGCSFGCYLAARRFAFLKSSSRTWLINLLTAIAFLAIFLILKNIISSVWIILAVAVLLATLLAIPQKKKLITFLRSFIQ